MGPSNVIKLMNYNVEEENWDLWGALPNKYMATFTTFNKEQER